MEKNKDKKVKDGGQKQSSSATGAGDSSKTGRDQRHLRSIQTAVQLKEKGNAHFREEKHWDAVCSYTDAVLLLAPLLDKESFLNRAIVYNNRAVALLRLQSFLEVLRDSSFAIELCQDLLGKNEDKANQTFIKALFRQAKAFQAVGNIAKALEAYSRSADLISRYDVSGFEVTPPVDVSPDRINPALWEGNEVVSHESIPHRFKTCTDNHLIREGYWRQYSPRGELPPARESAGAVIYNKRLYLFGGQTHSSPTPSSMSVVGPVRGTRKMNDLHSLNLKTMSWTRLSPAEPPSGQRGYPSPRSRCSALTWGGKMWIFGGELQSSSNGTVEHSSAAALETANRPSIPKSNPTSVAKMGDECSNELYTYDFSTSKWSVVPTRGDIPPPRHSHGAALWRGPLSSVGASGSGDSSSIPTADSSSSSSSSSSEHNGEPDCPHTQAGYDGESFCPHCRPTPRMIIYGGQASLDTFNDLYEYDFATSIWYCLYSGKEKAEGRSSTFSSGGGSSSSSGGGGKKKKTGKKNNNKSTSNTPMESSTPSAPDDDEDDDPSCPAWRRHMKSTVPHTRSHFGSWVLGDNFYLYSGMHLLFVPSEGNGNGNGPTSSSSSSPSSLSHFGDKTKYHASYEFFDEMFRFDLLAAHNDLTSAPPRSSHSSSSSQVPPPPASFYWTRLTPHGNTPAARAEFSSCIVKGRAYIFGGYTGPSSASARALFLGDCFEFSPRKPPMPTLEDRDEDSVMTFSDASAVQRTGWWRQVVYNDETGGKSRMQRKKEKENKRKNQNNSPPPPSSSSSTTTSNDSNSLLSQTPAMRPSNRAGHVMVSDGNKIYAIGGYTSHLESGRPRSTCFSACSVHELNINRETESGRHLQHANRYYCANPRCPFHSKEMCEEVILKECGERCGHLYCSKICQIDHWPVHRENECKI